MALSFIGPRLREYETQTLKELVEILVINTYEYCGKVIDKVMYEEQLDEFIADLQKYCGTITLAELRICLKNGSHHRYGKVFELSFGEFFKWINIFIMDAERLRIRKMVERRETVADKPMLTAAQKEQIIIDTIVSAFESYKAGARGILILTTVAYDYLKELGAINISPESQSRIQNIVKVQLREEAIQQRGTKSIPQALETITKDVIINASKRRALAEYYDQLVEMDDNIAEIIADCKNQKENEK